MSTAQIIFFLFHAYWKFEVYICMLYFRLIASLPVSNGGSTPVIYKQFQFNTIKAIQLYSSSDYQPGKR